MKDWILDASLRRVASTGLIPMLRDGMTDSIFGAMNRQNSSLIIFCIVAFMASILFCSNVSAIRHTNVPNMLPPPRPPKQSEVSAVDASFYKWESRDVIEAFIDNGIEIEDIKIGITMDPLSPHEGTIFLMPSHGKDVGGYISSYDSKDELERAREYYTKMNKNPEAPAWRIFGRDNILVLISGKVPEEKSREYERVLNTLGKR
ncbi:MAG: hypothetical protein HY758_02645 [Nitrospirae bacterium]|nr:hypothetical protein [Nitrospirota bacterium]